MLSLSIALCEISTSLKQKWLDREEYKLKVKQTKVETAAAAMVAIPQNMYNRANGGFYIGNTS